MSTNNNQQQNSRISKIGLLKQYISDLSNSVLKLYSYATSLEMRVTFLEGENQRLEEMVEQFKQQLLAIPTPPRSPTMPPMANSTNIFDIGIDDDDSNDDNYEEGDNDVLPAPGLNVSTHSSEIDWNEPEEHANYNGEFINESTSGSENVNQQHIPSSPMVPMPMSSIFDIDDNEEGDNVLPEAELDTWRSLHSSDAYSESEANNSDIDWNEPEPEHANAPNGEFINESTFGSENVVNQQQFINESTFGSENVNKQQQHIPQPQSPLVPMSNSTNIFDNDLDDPNDDNHEEGDGGELTSTNEIFGEFDSGSGSGVDMPINSNRMETKQMVNRGLRAFINRMHMRIPNSNTTSPIPN